MKHKRLKDAYIEFFNSRNYHRIDEWHHFNQCHGDNNKTLAYTITIKYHARNHTFKVINTFLEPILTKIMIYTGGNNWRRQHYFLPETHMFCDVANSKNGNKSIKYEKDEPHHHGIIYIHPHHADKWQGEANIAQIKQEILKIYQVQTVDIQPLKTADDIKGWISYAVKFYLSNIRNNNASTDSYQSFTGNKLNGEGLRKSNYARMIETLTLLCK